MEENKKYCKHCGEIIDKDCIICPKCGKQVEELKGSNNPIIINNSASASASSRSGGIVYGRPKDKWVALILCILFGFFGAHKFYEGKAGMGILYLFTFGIFGIGWVVDIIIIACKPNPYFV